MKKLSDLKKKKKKVSFTNKFRVAVVDFKKQLKKKYNEK